MAKNKNKKCCGADGDQAVAGAAMLRRVFPLLARLAGSGTQRDKARNRRLLFSQYAGLVLIGLFHPVLQSARALVAAPAGPAVDERRQDVPGGLFGSGVRL